MPTEKDDRWLDVLAGKAAPHDAQARQAAALRHYFELQDQHEAALDEATQRRILNALEAKGAFAQPKQKERPVRPGLWAQAMGWLFPQGHASGGRFAGVAVAVLAVTMLPFLLHPPGGDDDPGGMKNVPLLSGAPTAVIDSTNPDQLAAQLVSALSRQGVNATLRSEGADRWVTAKVPAERMGAVQAELVSMGLAATPQGDLSVQFRRQP